MSDLCYATKVHKLPMLSKVHRTMLYVAELPEKTAKLSRCAGAWNSTDVNRATLILKLNDTHFVACI